MWGREFEAQHRPLAQSPAPARAPAGGGSLQKLPGRLQPPRWPQCCATGDGARRAAELRRLGNFSRNAVRGRAPVDTCQRTVSVTVPGKRAERPRPAARSPSRAGGGASGGGERYRSVRPGDRVGVWVAWRIGAQCLLDAGTGQGLPPGGRDRTAGTGARGGRWPLPGRRADREEVPPCGQSHRCHRRRRRPGLGPRLPIGLGGPAVLTAPVSLKMVTSFLLACL